MIVHWLEQSTADVPDHQGWLTASELARIETMRFARRRADWRLGRWTAKCAVASRLGLSQGSLAEIEIRSAASGAPEAWISGIGNVVTISLSHRGGGAICAVAPPGVALGCDLELVETHTEAFVSDYFTVDEQRLVASAANRWRTVALLWSAKESGLKALLTGLRLDTRSVSIAELDPSSGHAWRPFKIRAPQDCVFYGWSQAVGQIVRTIVGHPQPLVPIQAHAFGSTARSGASS